MAPQASTPCGHLFSRFVGRVAGIPASSLESLCASRTLQAYAMFQELSEELERLRGALTPILHASIQGLENRELRRNLIQLKRDVHNRRPLGGKRLEEIKVCGLEGLVDELGKYHRTEVRRRDLGENLKNLFSQETTEIRRKFQDLVRLEDFKKGLLLSSRTLAGRLSHYVGVEAGQMGSRARQVERSLMRYFSRAVMKTTPFSTFCALVPGTFEAEGWDGGAAAVQGDPFRKRGLLRMNKMIYAQIVQHLQGRSGVRRHFQVEFNPTLRDEGGRWVFLAAAGGKEVFQRLPRNGLLEDLRGRLAETTVSLAELIEFLLRDPELEAEEEEVVGYLNRLLEIGFLRFRVGIREQEVDWDQPLATFLEGIDDEHATALRCLLLTLRAAMEEYADAPAERRREILGAAGEQIKDLGERLQVDLLPERQPIFYEDVGGGAELHVAAGDLEDVLSEYTALVSRMAKPRTEQIGMRHFFDSYYGPDHGPVQLLSFYEDYFREHFKVHLDRQNVRWMRMGELGSPGPVADPSDDGQRGETDLDNPFDLGTVHAINGANRGLEERIRELWREKPRAEEICLQREDLMTILRDVPEEGTTCRSASLFVQWVPGFGTEGESALVINETLNGYGKYFSRFLAVLPDQMRRDLIANNRCLTRKELAEICGDGAFNGNLHPPLLPREISYPTGESGAAAEQIPSARLEVERDPQDPHRLRLKSQDGGAEIIPVDLGFLNPRLRPPLFQLLSRFTPPANFDPRIPETLEDLGNRHLGNPNDSTSQNHDPETEWDGVRYRPRITYRGRLILARRQWQIPLALFPHRGKKESEADYFLRLQEWRRELGLPEEVFLRVRAGMGGERSPQTPAPPPLRANLHKPQYIDFRNPLLVDLFSRSAENLHRATFTFEERLPNSGQLLAGSGERCVTEFIVQVDFPEKSGEAANG